MRLLIKVQKRNWKICQLDLHDFKSLDVLKYVVQPNSLSLNKKFPQTLVLRHLKHIDNWSVLFKFFDVKTIKFDNCELNAESDRKNGWWDCISKMFYNRKNNKNLNKEFGDLEIIINGKKLDL